MHIIVTMCGEASLKVRFKGKKVHPHHLSFSEIPADY